MSNRGWIVIIAISIVILVVSFLAGNIAVQFNPPAEETVIVENNDRYVLPIPNKPATSISIVDEEGVPAANE